MTNEVIELIFGIGITLFMTAVVWQSIVMIQEKKDRQRRGLSDYYDNPVKKEEQDLWDTSRNCKHKK